MTPPGLATPSVRRRVLVGVLLVLGLTVLTSGVVVATVFDRQTSAASATLLAGRLQLARQLAQQDVAPQRLAARIDAQGVRARLVLATGETFGEPLPGGGVRRQATLTGDGRLGGAIVTVAVDTTLLDGFRSTLVRALVITGLAALLVGGLLAALATRVALRPLRGIAASARRIAGGERGLRLRPHPARGDVGETAAAMDAMLDELEGAEWRAVDARRRTEQFLADAAHELRTPLAGVSAAAETLLHHRIADDEREQLLALLVREAQRGSRVVEDLLVTARLEAPRAAGREPVPLTALAADEAERVRAGRPGLRATVIGPPVEVVADVDAVRTVLRNLLDNAVRAAGDTGLVTVVVRPSGPEGRVVVDVADSGPGVPPADRERIFQRLVRLDPARSRTDSRPGAEVGGSGLGLAIVRRHARALGGDVTYLGEQQRGPETLLGAVFRWVLPQATTPSTIPVQPSR